ncbi:glycosyltransferase [Litorivicinus lipolyticus]|uniref:glycosyltransferase n=1 Tax=Litorivicinus lipolyticus TaxID=418701 RepID=UPI003B5ADB7D
MIFLTVGSQLPFDRLVIAADQWAAQHPDTPVIAQIGQTDYQPRALNVIDTLSPSDYLATVRESSLVLSHVGMGTIINCLNESTPMVLLPRSSALAETRNEHQVHTAEKLNRFALMNVVWDADDLGNTIDRLLSAPSACMKETIEVDAALLNRLRNFVDQT